MNILIVGVGVIGCIYGYILEKAGHKVSHFIRKEKYQDYLKIINISLLDGRQKHLERKKDTYKISIASDSQFDLIILSVPNYQLKQAIEDLNISLLKGTILIFSNIWEDQIYINKITQGREYILGFPVAGGAFENKHSELNCVLFKDIYIEKKKKAKIFNHESVVNLFHSCHLKIKSPHNMLEWIWIHIAINMGLLNVIIENGGIEDSEASIKKVIFSVPKLGKAIRTIRIYLKIVKKRDVRLWPFLKQIFLFYLPVSVSAILMKYMFKNSPLTREIILLHNNKDDLLAQYQRLLNTGKKFKILLN